MRGIPSQQGAPAGSHEQQGARAGFTLIELLVTMILLGVVFTVSVSILGAVARERRSAEQRQYAMQYAANLLERAAAKGWAALPPGQLPGEPAPPAASELLPELQQSVEVADSPSELGARQITVSIRWKSRAGQFVSPVQLTTWVYPLEQGAP